MNYENYQTFNREIMSQIAFKTLSTKMKQEYFREKYEYIIGKKFRTDVYIPNKCGFDDDIRYATFFRVEDNFEFDYKMKKFASKSLHHSYIVGSDVAWEYRYNELYERIHKLYNSCRNKYWRIQKQKNFLKYGFH